MGRKEYSVWCVSLTPPAHTHRRNKILITPLKKKKKHLCKYFEVEKIFISIIVKRIFFFFLNRTKDALYILWHSLLLATKMETGGKKKKKQWLQGKPHMYHFISFYRQAFIHINTFDYILRIGIFGSLICDDWVDFNQNFV